MFILVHKSQAAPAIGKQIFTTVRDNQTEVRARPTTKKSNSSESYRPQRAITAATRNKVISVLS